MTAPGPKERRSASKDALKTIYFVILGIAVTESLEGAFLDRGRFIGHDIVKPSHWTSILLLLAFLPTAVRFAHGSSIHMDVMHEKAYKPLLDFIGFLVQASILYLMSEALDRARTFTILFSLLLVFDTLWLVMLRWRRYLVFGKTEWQWLTTNGILLVIFVIAYVLVPLLGRWAGAIVAIGAVGATIADYVMNRDFYFPVRELEHDHKPYATTEPVSTQAT
jgi:hypothetical protein